MNLVRAFLAIVIIVVVLAVGWLMLPMDTSDLESQPNPAQSYEEAVERIQAFEASDATEDLRPECATQFMTHNQPTERVIVFLHGYTACPEQFRPLGDIFFALGYNVFIPRMPHHGLADRMTPRTADLKAVDVLDVTDESVDIAQGLGEHITVAGLSAGGVMAAWAGQNRSDIDQILLAAPVFGVRVVPAPFTEPVAKAAAIYPNQFVWWNTEMKENIDGPMHRYPRISTHGLVELLRIGFDVQRDAVQSPPDTTTIFVITNDNDQSVNDEVTGYVVDAWEQYTFLALETYTFDASLELNHNIVGTQEVNQRIEVTYPVIVEFIHGELPPNFNQLLAQVEPYP